MMLRPLKKISGRTEKHSGRFPEGLSAVEVVLEEVYFHLRRVF